MKYGLNLDEYRLASRAARARFDDWLERVGLRTRHAVSVEFDSTNPVEVSVVVRRPDHPRSFETVMVPIDVEPPPDIMDVRS